MSLKMLLNLQRLDKSVIGSVEVLDQVIDLKRLQVEDDVSEVLESANVDFLLRDLTRRLVFLQLADQLFSLDAKDSLHPLQGLLSNGRIAGTKRLFGS